jgi:hypothetical protein
MLAEKSLTFSEIQEQIAIDSGHLSYHLESLGDLVAHNGDGKYFLSSIGTAAVRLMSGVEEQTPASINSKPRPSDVVCKILSLILAGILVFASVHFVTYAVPVSTVGLSQDHIHPTPLLIGAGETIEFNTTLTERELWLLGTPPLITTGSLNLFEVNGTYAYTFGIPWMTRNATMWDLCSIWLDLKLEMSSVPVGSSSIPHATLQMPPFSDLSVRIHKPDGTIETSEFDWVSLVWGINHIRLKPVEVTQLGTYRFEITNNNSYDWNGVLIPDVEWQLMTKPYFYYGVMGLVISTVTIAFIVYALISKHITKN